MSVPLINRRRRSLSFVGLVAVAIAAALCLAAPVSGFGGSANPEFGSTRPPTIGARAVAIDPTGRIVVAGTVAANAFVLARYTHDGRLDKTFGAGGEVLTRFPAPGRPHGGLAVADSLAIEPSGRIVAAGESADGFALARYRPNGALDTSFASHGRVTTGFGEEATANGVAIDSAGRIVAAGSYCIFTNCSLQDAALVRYKPDGRLDNTFGSGGEVTGGLAYARAIAIDASGRIVVAGRDAGFGVARFLPDGSLDPTFGSGGVGAQLGDGAADAIDIDPAGRIVAGGWRPQPSGFTVARYTPSGAFDPSFGSGGIVAGPFAAGVSSLDGIGVDPNGGIVAAGTAGFGFGSDFGLAGFTASGHVDPAFGTGGTTTTDFRASSGDSASGMAIDSGGRIIIAGSTTARATPHRIEIALARYRPGGALDPNFGNEGLVTTGLLPTNTVISRARIGARRRRASFSFRATGPATGFQCALRRQSHSRSRFTDCRSPKIYARLKHGRYVFVVRALRPGGPDRTPAKRRFRIPRPPRTQIARALVNKRARGPVSRLGPSER